MNQVRLRLRELYFLVLQGGLGAEGSKREMHGWCPWGVLEVPSGILGTIYT